MKISTKAYYGVMAMLHIAERADKKPAALTLSELSEILNISVSYLEQLFALLRAGKLVKAKRGPGGGYQLSRDSSEISVAEVINAVSPRMGHRLDTENEINRMWFALSDRLHNYLDGISLADVMAKPEVIQNVA